MKDEEFLKLTKSFFKNTIIILIFIIPFTIALATKFGYKTSSIEKDIINKKSMTILITENHCLRCKEIKKILKEKNVTYYELNLDKTTINDYNGILRKIKMTKNDIVIPTLITIEKGVLKSSLVDIKSEYELLSYIDSNT